MRLRSLLSLKQTKTPIDRLQATVPGKTKLAHDTTVESKANHENEKRLTVELNDFVNMLKRRFFQNDILDLYQIRNSLVSSQNTLENEFTYDIIYPHVQKGYELGSQYINRLLGKNPILLDQDTNLIEQMARFYNQVFWNRIQDVIDHNYLNFFSIDNSVTPLSNNYVITSLATAICWKPLSVGTVVKQRMMIKTADLQNPNAVTFPIFHAGVKQIEKQLLERNPGLFFKTEPFEGEELNIPAFRPLYKSVSKPKFIILVWQWVTSQDAKVCQKCTELSQQEWPHDETNLPENPDDSHPNCRCRLMLAESDRPIL